MKHFSPTEARHFSGDGHTISNSGVSKCRPEQLIYSLKPMCSWNSERCEPKKKRKCATCLCLSAHCHTS